MSQVPKTARDNAVSSDWLDSVFESRPGRGWPVNKHLSIFNSRSGFKVFAGPNGANDSDDSFAVLDLQTRGQVLDLMTLCGHQIVS